MSIPLTLVVLIAGAPPDPAFANAILHGAVETLGAETQVVFREAAGVPAESDVVALETSEHADAIAVVFWADAAKSHAELRVHVSRPPRWLHRDLGFAASDAPAEEGRAVGFAVASMIPVDVETPPAVEPVVPAAPSDGAKWRAPFGAIRLAGVGADSEPPSTAATSPALTSRSAPRPPCASATSTKRTPASAR
jgi:hypothetical protein